MPDIPSFLYAATVVGGGVLGYVKSKSIPSLSAGLVFGTLLGVGAFQTSRDPTNITLSLGTSAVLGGVMGHRYYTTGKVVPAGALTILSAAMCLRYVVNYYLTTTTTLKAK